MTTVSIEKAKTAFRQWREQREGGPGHAPDDLKRMALSICRQLGETQTCEALGISSSTLWRWRQKPQPVKKSRARAKPKASMASKPRVNSGVKPAPAPAFIDLTSAVRSDGSQSNGSMGTLCIEWQRADGDRVKVSGARLELAQVEH